MAAMCIKQNKYHEAEVYANQGYSCVFDNKLQSNLIVSAEFSALMVLIDINLETRALAQSKRFLERAHYLDCYLDNSETRYFDRIRLFELNAKYCELVRNFECAMHYNNLAKPYKDSLEKRNNIRTFKNIELRLLSNDFQEKIEPYSDNGCAVVKRAMVIGFRRNFSVKSGANDALNAPHNQRSKTRDQFCHHPELKWF